MKQPKDWFPKPVTLRPAAADDKLKVFKWLTQSNLSGEMFGPPKFPDNPAPTWADFDNDYRDHYFNETQPLLGRCFIILEGEEEVGQVNYNAIRQSDGSTELDIWLCDRRHTGRGIGPKALLVLCTWLGETYACRKFFMQPSARNIHAIAAYKRAGFHP